MSRLGIDRQNGLIYEGRGDPSYPVWPTPVFSQVTLIETPIDFQKIPHDFEREPFTWVFREDFFDPVSRIRRGRLFQKFGNQGHEYTNVEVHPALRSDIQSLQPNGKVQKSLSIFIECTELLNKPNKGEGLKLAIGVVGAFSMWRIVQTERTIGLDILVTLRAESAFGILPELDVNKIQPESLASITSAIARVLDAAYKELPTSVVDQCRNAATVLISRWMQYEMEIEKPTEKDLGALIKEVNKQFCEKPKVALCSALEIINRLHPRGKDNEAARMELRTVSESDAELAVHALGFVIRDIGWAKA
ncbi:MAG: hypothetical protein Q7K26_06550 [bacterium]|nr:hypothetical protein [bacterium]